MVDNLRFFAGAARCLEGRRAGRVRGGLHLDHPPRADRRRRPDHPLELPADDGRLEDRPGAGGRQHGRPEAGRDDAGDDAQGSPSGAAEILPPGVFNVIGGHGEPAGSELVTHPEVEMVSLTGSPETGKWIAKAAADTLKRVHLELGGKAPVVVFDDVEMETAMETIAGTGYYNAGQDCTAATRVLAAEGRLRRRRQRASPSRRRTWSSATRLGRGHHARPAQLASASASASRGSSSASRATPRSSPAARSPTCRASTSSRPSSPASSRTTR